LPPRLPNSAAVDFGSLFSSISPIEIMATLIVLPITGDHDYLPEGSRYGATSACVSLLGTTGTISKVTPKSRHCRTHSWKSFVTPH